MVLTRRRSERIKITVGGHTVWVTLVDVDRGKARIGFEAHGDVQIDCEEISAQREQKQKAGAK